MVRRCFQQGPDERPVYINICSWKRVPAPQDPSRPLPVWAGKLETDTNEGELKGQSRAALQATELTFVTHDADQKNKPIGVFPSQIASRCWT